MRLLLALIAVFMLAGCISAPSSPLESVAAEAPADAQAYAYVDTRALATNQYALDAVTGGQVPAFVGHLLIIAPECRVIMHNNTFAVGFKTVGPGLIAQFATPFVGDYDQKTYLGKTYHSGDPSVFARMGEAYIGDEAAIREIIKARSGANAIVPHSQLIKKVPKGDIMLVTDTGLMVIALSARLHDELAVTTAIVQTGSPLEAQGMATLVAAMPTAEGISINGASTDGPFVIVTGTVDMTKVDSLDGLMGAFALSPTPSMPPGSGGLPSGDLPSTTPKSFDDLDNVPGNASSEEELEDYCLAHKDECMQWALQEGYLTAGDLAGLM